MARTYISGDPKQSRRRVYVISRYRKDGETVEQSDQKIADLVNQSGLDLTCKAYDPIADDFINLA